MTAENPRSSELCRVADAGVNKIKTEMGERS